MFINPFWERCPLRLQRLCITALKCETLFYLICAFRICTFHQVCLFLWEKLNF